MSESVVNPNDLVRIDHISKVKAIFKEPGQMGWTKEALQKVDELYNIAVAEDPTDPIAWIDEFNRSHPHALEIGAEKSRIAKILVMAEIYVAQRKKKQEKRDERFA